jgi:integrase
MACIEKRGESWRITVSAGKNQDGTRNKIYRTFKQNEVFQPKKGKSIKASNKTNVENIAKILEGEVLSGEYKEEQKRTVKMFIEEWLGVYVEANVAGTTRQRYKELIDNYVIPNIGGYQLEQIKAPVLINLYKELQQPGARKDGNKEIGLSGSTVLQLHRILHRAFQSACEWDYIDKNPLQYVKGPTKNKPHPHSLTVEQVIIMLDRAQKEEEFWFFTLLSLAATSGLRRGEILALTWADCNFTTNMITVNQSLQYIKKEGLSTKAPKTEKSHEAIPVPSDVMKVLETHKKRQVAERLKIGSKWQKKDLVFPNWCGDYQHPDNVTHLFKEFMVKIDLPDFHFHNLRHTTASILINKGEAAKSVQETLRHATLATTSDIYSELFVETKRRTADKLSGLVPIVCSN